MYRALILFFLLCVPLAFAQGRGGMRGQGQRNGPVGQNRSAQQRGTQQQTRQRSQIASRQQAQYRKCDQAHARLQKRVREMNRVTRQQRMNTQQMRQAHQQFRTELRRMQQENESLMAGLDSQQKDRARNQIQNVSQNQEELVAFSDALGFELEQVTPDQDRIRDQVRDLDRSTRQLQERQHDLANELGLN